MTSLLCGRRSSAPSAPRRCSSWSTRSAGPTAAWAGAFHAVQILDGHGRIVEWLGAASDVMPRKQLEVALREAAETLALLLDSPGAETRVECGGAAALALPQRWRPAAVLLTWACPAWTTSKWRSAFAPIHRLTA